MASNRQDDNFKTTTPLNALQPHRSLYLTPQKNTTCSNPDTRQVNSAPRSTRFRSKKTTSGQASQRRSLPFTRRYNSCENSLGESSKGDEEKSNENNTQEYKSDCFQQKEEIKLNSKLVDEGFQENGLNLLSEVASSQQDSEDRKLNAVFNSPARLFKNSQETNNSLSLPSLSFFQSQKQTESQPSQPKIELQTQTAEFLSQVEENKNMGNKEQANNEEGNRIDNVVQDAQQVNQHATEALQAQDIAFTQQYTQQQLQQPDVDQQQQQQQQQQVYLQQYQTQPTSQPLGQYYGYMPPPVQQGQTYLQSMPIPLPQPTQLQQDNNNMDNNVTKISIKPEHKDSRAIRRGPMDEMRQLVRIMVKIFPQSQQMLNLNEEGAGNKISEDQIKRYLDGFLGDAPKPEWGVPQGWGAYLAQLFSWATGRHICSEDARSCATRRPGRAWEVNNSKLEVLGLNPSSWPIPLSKQCADQILPPIPQLIATPPPLSLPPPVRFKRPNTDILPQTKTPQQIKRKKITEQKAVAPFQNTCNVKPAQIEQKRQFLKGCEQLDIWKKISEDIKQLSSEDKLDVEVMKEIQKAKESVWELMKPHMQHIATQDVFANSHVLSSNGSMYRMVQMDADSQLPSINFSLPNVPLHTIEVEENNNAGTQQKRQNEDFAANFNIPPLNVPPNPRPTSAPQFHNSQTHAGGVVAQGIIDYNNHHTQNFKNFSKNTTNNNNQLHRPNKNTQHQQLQQQQQLQLPNGFLCSQNDSNGVPQRDLLGVTVTGTPAIQKYTTTVKDENQNNVAQNQNITKRTPSPSPSPAPAIAPIPTSQYCNINDDVANNNNCNDDRININQRNSPQENDRNAGNNKYQSAGDQEGNANCGKIEINQGLNQQGQNSVQISLQPPNGGSPMTVMLQPGQQMDEWMLRLVSQFMFTAKQNNNNNNAS